MIDKRQSTEQIAEEILEAYAKELMKSRADYYQALEDEEEEEPPLFAEPVREKVQVRRRISARRIIALIAILVLLMGLAVISSEGGRKQMFHFFQTEKEGYTELDFIGGAYDEEEGIPDFRLGYVPKGYELKLDEKAILKNETGYLNDAGGRIIFTVSKSENSNLSIDNDSFKRKEITVNGNQAFLFYSENESLIIWEVGDYILDLLTSENPKETQKIAENIVLKKN